MNTLQEPFNGGDFRMPSVSTYLERVLLLALNEHRDLHKKWVDVTMKLYGLGGQQAARFQHDVRIDLLLRTLERERLGRPAHTSPEDPDLFVFEHQLGLSRLWVMSTYEALRSAQVKQRRAHPKLIELHRKFEMVRVPLAKLEIAQPQNLDPATRWQRRPGFGDDVPLPYVPGEHPPTAALCTVTGSFGWYPLDVKTMKEDFITRRMLSDQLLALFD